MNVNGHDYIICPTGQFTTNTACGMIAIVRSDVVRLAGCGKPGRHQSYTYAAIFTFGPWSGQQIFRPSALVMSLCPDCATRYKQVEHWEE